jgi:hypothetical protein
VDKGLSQALEVVKRVSTTNGLRSGLTERTVDSRRPYICYSLMKVTVEGIGAGLHQVFDHSLTFGIGHRLDGWANRDLNIGAIAALAPNLQPVADLLGVDISTVRTVLNSWGPGKFDAELFLDGKTVNPRQMSHGVLTGTNVSGATMIPNAFGLAGFNQHT